MSGHTVNLMPWREQRRQRCRRFWMIWFVVAGVGMAFTTLVLQVNARSDRQLTSLWLQSDTDVLSGVSSREPVFKVLREQWVQQQARHQRRQMMRAWQERLSSLAEKMPTSAWLTALHFRNGQLELAGLTRNFAALSEIEQVLRATHGFQLQQTGATERDTQGNWQFRFQLDKETDDAPQP